MRICGIICEYNPFHNGHLYHIEETKKRGAEAIICVMSGNFVQRADFAVMRKHARAECAIRAGADVVLELPVPWSIASAECFAFGAVSLLDALGVVTDISFGCEADSQDGLLRITELLLREDFGEAVLEEYSKGISFAKARELAVAKFDKKLSGLLSTPNNILAIEYLKALSKLSSDISPICITRSGSCHDDTKISDGFASASAVRGLIAKNADISQLIPACSDEILKREIKLGHAPVFSSVADTAMLSSLKKLSADDFLSYGDVSEGLQFRLENAISKSTTLSEAIALAKTKRYAHSRIRRIYLNAFLGIKNSFSSGSVPYARLLALNETGKGIMRMAKKASKIPIITRPSSVKYLDCTCNELLSLERKCDDIYSLFMNNPIEQGSTYTISPILRKED